MMSAEKSSGDISIEKYVHRTIQVVKGPQKEGLQYKPAAQSRASSGVKPGCSGLGQVGA